MSKPKQKLREFWMDKDALDAALERCDLGESRACTVSQYPRKSMMIEELVHVREVRPPTASLESEIEQAAYQKVVEWLNQGKIDEYAASGGSEDYYGMKKCIELIKSQFITKAVE